MISLGSAHDTREHLRIRTRESCWSNVFVPDPSKLNWQKECLSIKTPSTDASTSPVLYEFGISADYATETLGNLTTLISIIPRYLCRFVSHDDDVLCSFSHLYLQEVLPEDHPLHNTSDAGNIHTLALSSHSSTSSSYAWYWLSGQRTSIALSLDSTEKHWTVPFSFNNNKEQEGIQYRKWQSNQWIEINIRQGHLSEATWVIEFQVLAEPPPLNPLKKQHVHGNIAEMQEWHVQSHVRGCRIELDHFITCRVGNLQCNWTERVDAHRGNLYRLVTGTISSISVEDLRVQDTSSVFQIICQPVTRNHRSSKDFCRFTYEETTNVRLRVIQQFLWTLEPLAIHIQSEFLEHAFDWLENIQASSHQSVEEKVLPDFLSSIGRRMNAEQNQYVENAKVYIQTLVFSPFQCRLTYHKHKSLGKHQSMSNNFWYKQLKIKINDAALEFPNYKLTECLATHRSIFQNVTHFYHDATRAQALLLIESVQVVSLVSNLVQDGVSSMLSSISGTLGLTTNPHNDGTSAFITENSSQSCSQRTFRPKSLTNHELFALHSQTLTSNCTSQSAFVQTLAHLVFDWDSNHVGLEARPVLALGMINHSKSDLVLSTTLEEGSELRILPLSGSSSGSSSSSSSWFSTSSPTAQRRVLPGVSSDTNNNHPSNTWDPRRSCICVAVGGGGVSSLLTLGSTREVFVQMNSHAVKIHASMTKLRVRPCAGYTATVVDHESRSWWSRHVIVIADSISELASDDDALLTTLDEELLVEFDVIFNEPTLGLFAIQHSSNTVSVKKFEPPQYQGNASTRKIHKGDIIVSVNGIAVKTTGQFRNLVVAEPRPIMLRFRRPQEVTPSLFG